MTLNHNCGCFSGVGSGIAGNGLQLYAVVCRLCAVGKLRIGAVMCSCGLIAESSI